MRVRGPVRVRRRMGVRRPGDSVIEEPWGRVGCDRVDHDRRLLGRLRCDDDRAWRATANIHGR